MPPTETASRTVAVILGICLVCSLAVSTATVALRPRQEENRRLDRIATILTAAGLPAEAGKALSVYEERIEPMVIDLETGEQVSPSRSDTMLAPQTFSVQALVDDPRYSRALSPEEDLAGIQRMPRYMRIYLLKQNNGFGRYILPVYGKGAWSTIRGFLALQPDLNTVADITFHEQGETPGLGGEIANPRWQRQWRGKQVYDQQGEVRLALVKEAVDGSDPMSRFKIDALAGATLTSRGVERIIRFWLGKNGYAPYIRRLQGRSRDRGLR